MQARATTLVAVTTVAARIAGFVRVSVFGRVFGAGMLGDTYLVANTVPNVIYESVVGGALAGVVVPVLAGPIGPWPPRSSAIWLPAVSSA